VVLVLTGCSSSGNKASSSSSSSSSSGTNSSSKSDSSSSSGGGDGNAASKCADATQALQEAGNVGSFSAGQKLQDQAFAARDAINSLADSVNDSSTKDALHTIADAYDEFGNKVGDIDYDPTSGDPPPAAVVSAIQVFANTDFAQAAAKLSQFFAGGCK
jgi:hypothetical protein